MLKTRLVAGSAATLLVMAAAAAFAIPRSFYVHSASATDLTAAKGGQGSLSRAISATEELTGGRVLEIHFDGSSGAGHYEATVSRNGTIDHAMINAATGQVAIIDPSQASGRTFEYKEKADSEVVVRGAKIAIRDAVANAEQSSRGVAISARTTSSGDGYMVAHDIETVRGSMVHPVLVDAKTGMVIQDNQAFASQP